MNTICNFWTRLRTVIRAYSLTCCSGVGVDELAVVAVVNRVGRDKKEGSWDWDVIDEEKRTRTATKRGHPVPNPPILTTTGHTYTP